METSSGLKVKEVTVSFGGTVNLGNYENFKIDLSVSYQVDTEVFALEDIAREAFAEVRQLVRDEVAKLESRNIRGWLRDTDLKAEKAPVADTSLLPLARTNDIDEDDS
jgi:hypothetical protein